MSSLGEYLLKRKQGQNATAIQNGTAAKGRSLSEYAQMRNRSGSAAAENKNVDGAYLSEFNTDLISFSDQFAAKTKAREGTYQSSSDFAAYRTGVSTQLNDLLTRANASKDYITKYGYLYEDKDGILSSIDSGIDYLNRVNRALREEADYWNLFQDENDYNIHTGKYDVVGAKKELERAEAEMAQNKQIIDSVGGFSFGTAKTIDDVDDAATTELGEARKRYGDAESRANTLRREIFDAEFANEDIYYMGLREKDDFEASAAFDQTIADQDEVYAYINGQNAEKYYGDAEDGHAAFNPPTGTLAVEELTADEKNTYNSIRKLQGKEAADDYLAHMTERLNQRRGERWGKFVRSTGDIPVVGELVHGAASLAFGADQWVSGARQNLTDERLPTSSAQYASSYVGNELEKEGWEVLGVSVPSLAYKIGTTTGNMLPGILLTKGLGAANAPAWMAKAAMPAMVGVGAKGNAYNQALADGYTKEQASAYSGLVGSAEAVLQYALGGLGEASGLTGKMLSAVDAVDNTFAKFALNTAIRTGGEIAEEELQLWLEPFFRKIVFNEKYEAPEVSEMLETALVTFFSTGLMEAGDIYNDSVRVPRRGARVLENDLLGGLVDSALDLGEKTQAYKIADELRTGKTAANKTIVGRLLGAYLDAGGNMLDVARPKMGAEGTKVVQAIAQRTGVSEREARVSVNLAYETGRHNLPGTQLDLDNADQRAAYQAGQADYLTESPNTKDLVTGQQEDYTDINKEMEAADYGAEEVHLRDGGQRVDGARAGGEIRAVEEGTGGIESRQEQSRPADGEAAGLTYGEKVSPASQGIGVGSTQATMQLVTGGETAHTAEAKRLAKEHNLRAIFYKGDLWFREENGKWSSANGYISGDRIFVKVDHPLFTADQIIRHEIAHDRIARGEINPDDVRARLRETFKEEKYEQLSQMYIEAYRETGLSVDEIWEEIICDSQGDMNIFSGLLKESAAAELLTETKNAVREGKHDTTEARGPPVEKASREANKFLRMFTGEVRTGEYISLSNVEYGTIKSNIKSRDTFLSDSAENGLVWAHSANKEYAYLFACNPNYSVTVTDVLDAGRDIAIINRITERMKHYGRSGASIRRSSSVDGRAGDGHRGGNIGSGAHAQAGQSGGIQSVAKQASAGNQRPGGTAGADNSQNGGTDSEAEVTPKASRDLPTLNDLRRENETLRGQVEELKKQTRRTREPSVRQKDVDKLAKRLVKDYGSTLKAEGIAGDIKGLADYIVRGGEKLNWSEARDRAVDVARKIVSSAQELANDDMEVWQDIRSYLKNHKLVFENKGDIADWAAFRKRNAKYVRFGEDGVPVDTAYQELNGLFGEVYFPSDIIHPTDQILHIAEMLAALEPVYANPYSYDMASAIEYVANDLMDSVLSDQVRQEPKTFADVQHERLEVAKTKGVADAYLAGQMEQGRRMAAEHRKAMERQQERTRKVQERLEAVRKARDEKIEKIKEQHREAAERKRERAADSKARTRLLNIVKRLKNKKLPAVNRALLDQYIGELDTVAKSLTDGKANDLRELRDWYEDQRENNPDFIADPAIEKAISRLSRKHIADLTAEEVADLTNVLLNIENELRTQRKLIDSADRRDTYEMGVQVISDIEATKGSKAGILGVPGRYIVTETLSPVRQVRRMTGYADNDPLYQLTNALADGQRTMFDFQRRAGEKFLRWTQDKKLVKRIAGKDAETIKISGISKNGPVTVEITPAMRMSLYLHSLNDQNLRHIAGGGVTIPDMKLYRQGKIAEAYARGTTIKLTPSQVRTVTDGMNTEERAFARAAHDYFNGMSQQSINEVSEKLKGYSLAQVEDYFPINTDTSFTKKEFEALKFDGTIEGMGFLKERVNSASPIMLRDMNAVVTQSIDSTAKYVGLAIPVRNFNKVWGVTKSSFNEDGSRNSFESSVQQAVKQKWGEDGYQYIENMMTDLNSGRPVQDKWAKVLNRIKSNYAGAVLTLSASVAMKQAASYPTAAAVVGWKPLAKAMKNFGKVDLDLINKYTPLQWYRTQGFSTQELGDMAKRNKSLPKVLNWVQGVDLITTRKLWKAAEYYVRQENKALTVGTDAYYRAVADIYNQIIEETQPNYTIMQRPQLLRTENSLMQNLSMFKTQPFQNFNILYDALGDLHAKQTAHTNMGTPETAEELKTAKRRAVWAVTSQVAQTAVFAGMTLAWNLLRGKTAGYEDEEEDEMTAASVLAGIGKDMIGGSAAMIPFGSDVWGFVSSKLFDETYYGMDAVTVTALVDSVTAIGGMSDLLADTAEAMMDDEEVNWSEIALKADNYFDDISKAMGIPYESVVNFFNAMYLQGAKAVSGKYVGEYLSMKLTTSTERYASDYYKHLYKAYKNDRAAYNAIYKDMLKSGFTREKIEAALKRLKKVG